MNGNLAAKHTDAVRRIEVLEAALIDIGAPCPDELALLPPDVVCRWARSAVLRARFAVLANAKGNA